MLLKVLLWMQSRAGPVHHAAYHPACHCCRLQCTTVLQTRNSLEAAFCTVRQVYYQL